MMLRLALAGAVSTAGLLFGGAGVERGGGGGWSGLTHC